MIGLEIIVQVNANKRAEFLQAVELLTRREHRNSACISQSLFEEVSVPNHFLWVEHWNSRYPLEMHMRTDRFRMLLGAIDVIGHRNDMRILEYMELSDEQDRAASTTSS